MLLLLASCSIQCTCSTIVHDASVIHFRVKRLSIVQKCDIAARELDELRDEIQRTKDDAERSHDNFRVSLSL